MIDTSTDPQHFTKAVTELGEKRPVVTTQAIFNDRGIKIIEKGAQVNAGLYERLMTHTLAQPIEDSVSSTSTVTGEFLRAQAEQALRDLPFLARISADGKTRSLLLDAVEKLPLPAPLAFQLTLACEVQPALFQHSLHMALVAAWFTLGPLVSRFDLSIAAAAGLLHDIGMLHLDPILLTPEQQIGRDQRRQLYSHPLISTTLLEHHHEYPREMLRAVKEHHEFLDGSGYPSSLSGQAISPLGRILSLSELVTTLLTPQLAACELRLSVMLRTNGHRYDTVLLERVLQHLKPQANPLGDGVTLVADPITRLLEIDAALSGWPAEQALRAAQNQQRRDGMAAVASQTAQLRRTLAGVGVAPQQLAQVGPDALDDFIQAELSLLTKEAAWQLRSLARQTRRRWQLEPDDQYPETLQTWLEQVDELVVRINSPAAALPATTP